METGGCRVPGIGTLRAHTPVCAHTGRQTHTTAYIHEVGKATPRHMSTCA